MAKFKPSRVEVDEYDAPSVAVSKDEPSAVAVQRPRLVTTEEPEEPEEAEATALIRRVWGDDILNDPAKVKAILQTQQVMAEETGKMTQSAINIGRKLNRLAETLSREEFKRGVRFSREVFSGWSDQNIFKVMSAADLLDRTKLPVAQVPQSYSILYEFSTLRDDEFKQAISEGIFRRDVRRIDILAFKRKLGEAPPPPLTVGQSPHAERLADIDRQIAQFEGEIGKLRRERSELMVQETDWHKGQLRLRS